MDPKVVELIDAQVEWWLPGGRSGGNGEERLVKGYKASVMQDK